MKGEMRLKKLRGALGERGCQIFQDGMLADDGKRSEFTEMVDVL